MAVANTIVPWLAEWLEFYEGWLVTGIWYGGGEHPNVEEVDGADRNFQR